MEKINIAIDGFAGTGKSTTAKLVAERLGFTYIDTGAMYRAVTYAFIKQNVDFTNSEVLINTLSKMELTFNVNPETGRNEVYLNGEPTEPYIRSMAVSDKVSDVSKVGYVRDFLVAQQQEIGKHGGVVMDGRDIGTVVLPSAELKIFMTADVAVRAQRRKKDLGDSVSLEELRENMTKRDLIDTTRQHSPLKKAEDAIELDTTGYTVKEQTDMILKLAAEAAISPIR